MVCAQYRQPHWYWLLGRGIIQEPDDIRPDNPPNNPSCWPTFERELVASHYDLKHVYRLILNSKTYQLSCLSRGPKAQGRRRISRRIHCGGWMPKC